MAGDWLKMRSNLWDDPRIISIVDATDSSEGPVIGALYWLWATADQHTADGFMPGLTLRQIDRKTGLAGFGSALVSVGWIAEADGGVTISRFEEHNGTSAKRRCTEAQRKASGRNLSACDADRYKTIAGQEEDEKRRFAELEKEKSKRDIIEEAKASSRRQPKASDTPDCPYQSIVDLYIEKLPELPGVKVMDEKRKRCIKTFWAWVFTSKRSDGQRRAHDADQALTWIGQYFDRAKANDFVMGRTGRSGDHRNWRADIEYLCGEAGRKQVIEKTVDA